jgi:hypothetical protein
MTPLPEFVSNWRKCELTYLALVIELVSDFIDHWGRRPTAEELRVLLKEH